MKILSLKQQIRKETQRKILNLSSLDKFSFSKIISDQLLSPLSRMKSFNNILCYSALADEVDLSNIFPKLLGNNKKLFFPKVENKDQLTIHEVLNLEDDFHLGSFGICEPSTPVVPIHQSEIDCLLIPLRAMDFEGGRLGRGKGFYDRFIDQLTKHNKKHFSCIGIGYDCQMIAKVPMEEHDHPMDFVMSEKGIFQIKNK